MSRVAVLLVATVTTACSAAAWLGTGAAPYELDEVSREAGTPCQPERLRVYRGEHVRLEPPITVAVPFEARVSRFEALVAEVGTRVYGRAPTRILNAGAYACRAVEHRPERLSEHALGNALDVTGFRFPALPAAPGGGASTAPPSVPAELRRAFTVTLTRDYSSSGDPKNESATLHQQFFRQLAEALRQSGIFRGLLGPSDPRHGTHFHLDMGPWSYERL